MVSVADKISCAPQTLHEWVKKAEVDSGKRASVPTDTVDKLKALEREVRELRQANEILRKASAYFAQAERARVFGARSCDDRVYRRSAPHSKSGSERSVGSIPTARTTRRCAL